MDDLAEHAEVETADMGTSLDDMVAIINTTNSNTHIAKVAPGPYFAPAMWRARCPWWYGYSPHTVAKPSAVLAHPRLRERLCTRCWKGVEGLEDESSQSAT